MIYDAYSWILIKLIVFESIIISKIDIPFKTNNNFSGLLNFDT